MDRTLQLKGKTALITGASSGLGYRFADVLSSAGATVILAGRRMELMTSHCAGIKKNGGAAYAVRLDVRDDDSILNAIEEAESKGGPIDILINNSGVTTLQGLTDVTPNDFDTVMGTNLRGAFFVAQEVAKRMRARVECVHRPGPIYRIVNIASIAGLCVPPGGLLNLYGISKAAMIQMTKAMAGEWGRYGINTNAICPGYIDTEITQPIFGSEEGEQIRLSLPRQRVGNVSDLDGLILLLTTDQSQFINGAVMVADDGFLVA